MEMRIKIEKNYLTEELDEYWKKKLDSLNSNVYNLNDRQEAMRQVLSSWEKDTKKYEKSDDTKKLLNKTIKSMLEDDEYGENGEGNYPSEDDIQGAKGRIPEPKDKKKLFQFFLALERLKEKDEAFYNAVNKCLNEMSANSLYWLCVDVNNAGYSDKQQIVDNDLKDADALVGGTTKRYVPARAFVLRTAFVKKYIKLFKPFAGQRELPPDSQPTPMPTGGDSGEPGSNKPGDNSGEPGGDRPGGDKPGGDGGKPGGNDSVGDGGPNGGGDKPDDGSKKDDKLFIYGSNQKREDPKSYTAIRIMDGVSTIGHKAFQGMSNVKKIFWYGQTTGIIRSGRITTRQYEGLPPSVVRINSGAFSDCTGIHRLVLPENIEYIGDKAFSGTDINNFNLGRKTKQISKDAFVGISSSQIVVYISAMSPFYLDLQKAIQKKKIKNISDYFSNGSSIQIRLTDEREKKKFDKKVQRLMKKR